MKTLSVSAPALVLRIPAADLDLDATFGCGQCFRWDRQPDGSWSGVAFGRAARVRRRGDALIVEGDPSGDAHLWRRYFDADRDYGAIKKRLSADPVLRRAVGYAPGIRILRQEPWEALCSFILSQNNNIPRIRGIVRRLCETFGGPTGAGGVSFPPAGRIAPLTPADLAPLRCGFRAGYLLDAARRVASGEIDLAAMETLPLDAARRELQKIKGVGPKVAECTLLFGCGRLECFPMDVWMKRVCACFYPEGFPGRFARYGGIAQQYLFHYARACPECGLGGARMTADLQSRQAGAGRRKTFNETAGA